MSHSTDGTPLQPRPRQEHQSEQADLRALAELEDMMQNQQALHHQLEDIAHMHSPDIRGPPLVNEARRDGRAQRQRRDRVDDPNGRSAALRVVMGLGLCAAAFAVFRSSSGDGASAASIASVDSNAYQPYKRQTSFNVAFDAPGQDGGWDSAANRFHSRNQDNHEGRSKHKQPHSADETTSWPQQYSWTNLGRYWRQQYKTILQSLEQDHYFLLRPHSLIGSTYFYLVHQLQELRTPTNDDDNNNGAAATPNRRGSIFFWTQNRSPVRKVTGRPTLMNMRQRFESVGLDNHCNSKNTVLSTFVSSVDSVMDWMDGILALHDDKQHNNSEHQSDKLLFVDKLIASTPRFLAIANTILILVYLLHGAVADFFLGPVQSTSYVAAETPATADTVEGDVVGNMAVDEAPGRPGDRHRRRQRGRGKLLGYLFFKVLLITAVVTPDALDLLVLLIWYSTMSLLRSLCHIAGVTITDAAQSGRPPRRGALVLLLSVLLCDGLAMAACTSLLRDVWSMLLLFICDCIILGNEIMIHCIKHFVAISEERHRELMVQLEERLVAIYDRRSDINPDDVTALLRLEQDSGLANREVETREASHSHHTAMFDKVAFALELLGAFVLVAHYVHVWIVHGASFGLVDAILFLHIQSTLSSVGRKIAERRNLYRILGLINEKFADASDIDIRKASTSGDVCCICLVTLSTGSVKKVGCGHLFHTSCLREVVERARSFHASKCPLCRASLVNGSHSWQQNETNDNSSDADEQQQQAQALRPLNNNNNQQVANQNLNEQSLFRFSTEGILPAWLPVPAFAFEVVRRESPALAEQNVVNAGGGLQRFFRRGGQDNANVDDTHQVEDEPTQQQQPIEEQPQSLWRRMFVLAGVTPMSPREEALALEQLTDMFPQYDRADLMRELRARRSAEAVVESIFLGVFSGTPRGGGGH